MATEAENLAQLQSAYASVCAKIAELEADSGPNFSELGRSVDVLGWLESLYRRRDRLALIPGVTTSAFPIINEVSVGRG